MKKRRIVANAREAWKWHSVQILSFIAAAPFIWDSLPARAQNFLMELVPSASHDLVITIVAVVGIVLRLRDQSGSSQ